LRQEGVTPPFDFDEVFQEHTGLPIGQFIWTGFSIFAKYTSGNPIMTTPPSDAVLNQIQSNWSGPQEHMPSKDSFEKFIIYLARDLAWYRKNIGDITHQRENLIAVDTRPLNAYPLIKTKSNELVIPIPKLLIDRVTSGIFHDFANWFQKDNGENLFREYFGHVFERYVGLQLELVFPSNQLFGETNYGRQGKSTPDWLVADPAQPIAIECRSRQFRVDTQMHADQARINSDLFKIGVDTLHKLPAKVEAISAGETPIPRFNADTIKKVLCTWEEYKPLGYFGGLMWKTVGEGMADVHLVPVGYLEDMCAFKDKSVFFSSLEQLKLDASWLNYVGDGPDARWEQTLPDIRPENPYTRGMADAFMGSLEDPQPK
jgi:hypothetical protein